MLQKIKEKLIAFGRKLKQAAEKAYCVIKDILKSWYENALAALKKSNPLEFVGTAVAVVGVVKKGQSMYLNWAEEQKRKRSFYDTRLGKRAWAKRKPSVKETIEINRRYREGESYVEILADLGLLSNR